MTSFTSIDPMDAPPVSGGGWSVCDCGPAAGWAAPDWAAPDGAAGGTACAALCCAKPRCDKPRTPSTIDAPQTKTLSNIKEILPTIINYAGGVRCFTMPRCPHMVRYPRYRGCQAILPNAGPGASRTPRHLG